MRTIIRKYLYFAIVFALAPIASFAQKGPGILWQKTYGGYWDEGAWALTATSDSGYVFGGTTRSDLVGYHWTPLRSIDYWITKISKTGNIEWMQVYGGTLADQINSIIQTSDNGYAVLGTTLSSDGDVNNNHPSSSYYEIWVLKLTPSGAIEWQTTLGGSRQENPYFSSILQTSEGGYIIGGTTSSTDGDVSLNHGGYDAWIVKLSPTGTIIWEKTFGGTSDEAVYSITRTTDSNYVFAGSKFVTGNAASYDLWIVKINNNGILQWEKTFGGSNRDEPYDIMQTLDEGFAIVGSTHSADGNINQHGQGDVWILKLNTTGDLVWQKTYGGSANDYGYSILQHSDSRYVISGTTASSNGDISFNHGASDVWILQIDEFGELQWEQTYGGSQPESGGNIAALPTGYVFIATTQSNDQDVSGLHDTSSAYNPGDGWFVEICERFGYALSAPAMNFGNVPLCMYRDTIIEIFDTGCYTFFIDSVKITGTDFQLMQQPRSKIATQQVDTFLIRYQPLTHGLSTGTVTLYYNERGNPKTLVIPLSATGSAGSVNILSSIDSFFYNFPPASTCSRADTQYITLKNLGCDTVKVMNVTFIDDGTTLIGSREGIANPFLFQEDTLLLRWITTPSLPGTFQAKIIVTLRFPNGSTRDTILTAKAVILGESTKLITSLSQTPYLFTSRAACTRVDSARFSIRNLGCDTLTIVNVTFSNDGSTLMGSGPTSGILIGNQELKYRWLLDPQQPGSYQASVTITYRLPDGSTRDTTFSANATVVPGAPLFSSSLSSDNYTFPSRSLCADNDTVRVIVRNGGCDTLHIVKVTFANTSELTGVLSYWDSTLGATDSSILAWIFDPAIQGTYSADIIITYKLPDGTEHDTIITATATVLPGDALFVSSLTSPDYTFTSRTACGDTDSLSFSIKNPGCDTLSIVDIAFVNTTGILEGLQSYGGGVTTLIADDSIVFRWHATASTPGSYLASITVTYKLPDGTQHDTTFTASIVITPGSKLLTQSIPAIDYGRTYICEERDTMLTFINNGCDTLTIYGLRVAGTGFSLVQPMALPIVVNPDDTVKVVVRSSSGDTTGHPLIFTDMLEVMSTADDGLLQIPLSRQLIYPAQFSLHLSAPASAANMQMVTYSISLAGAPPQELTAIRFDVTYHRDLLELLDFTPEVGINVTMNSTTYQGEIATTGFTLSPVPGPSIIATLRFIAYLAKVDTSVIRVGNVRFDLRSTMLGDCIASVDEGESVFHYDDACSEPTIRSFMQGISVFNIVGMRPQPLSKNDRGLTLELRNNREGSFTISCRDILGKNLKLLYSNNLAVGKHTLALEMPKLSEGVYFIVIETGGQSQTHRIALQ